MAHSCELGFAIRIDKETNVNEQFYEIWIGDADTPSQIGSAPGKDFRDACVKTCREIQGFDPKVLTINGMMLYEDADGAQADWDFRNLSVKKSEVGS